MKTTIDRTGRLVIPRQVREDAGYTPGVELNVEYRDGVVVIEPVLKAKLIRKKGLLVSHVPGARKLTLEETNRLIRRHREGRL